jgi:hypothetical protein
MTGLALSIDPRLKNSGTESSRDWSLVFMPRLWRHDFARWDFERAITMFSFPRSRISAWYSAEARELIKTRGRKASSFFWIASMREMD